MPDCHNGQHDPKDQISDDREESWAQRLGVEPHLNKNILEVILEKDNRGAFIVSDVECARLLSKLGLDLRPGVHVEGVQVCPNGRGIILIILKDTVKAENFCRYDVLQVTDSGIRSVIVRQAGKREVVMTLRGVHPNTKDNHIINYIKKFGTVPQARVVYGTYREGPLKGMLNGDRHYKVVVNPGVNIGSYHLIDGVKVTLRYAGQKQTCGRCYKSSDLCKGGGLAKRCETQGGEKIEFKQFITSLWQEIDYTPDNDHFNYVDDEIPASENFTPHKYQTFPTEKFTGVSIKHFPRDTDHGAILEFLCENGLPDDRREGVKINENGSVIVYDIDSYIVEYLIKSIHGKVKFGRKLYIYIYDFIQTCTKMYSLVNIILSVVAN